MILAYPLALLLGVALPLVWWLGRPRLPFRRRRDLASLLCRTLILVLCILALAGLAIAQPTRKLAVVFVVDASDSVGIAQRAEQYATIQRALANKPPEDEWGIVVFGADSTLEQQLTNRNSVQPLRSSVDSGNSNLADALNKAFGMFPADATARIVLLSDGRETIGNAQRVALRAQATNVEIAYIPFDSQQVADTRIVSLDVAPRVAQNQPFDVTVNMVAPTPTNARLLLFLNGALLQESALALQAGENRYAFSQQLDQTGLLNYSAQLIVPNDGFEQNNRLSAFSQVLGSARILVIANDPRETTALIPALVNAGYEVDTLTSGNLPSDTTDLASYRAIVVANVPATGFSTPQMARLQTYVRDLGGGLVFIGGERSYGLGGYSDTLLEQTLPVEMQIKDEERIPELTIAYLIDSSGSMETSDDGIYTYLDMAKQAIIVSLGLLQPTDRVAIGAFNSDGQWIERFQTMADVSSFQNLVAGITGGGGTDLLAGLRLVEKDIALEPAPLKHLIILTDGGSSSNGVVAQAQNLHDLYGVTITTINIGLQQPAYLQEIATLSDGNFYTVTDVQQIPNIFAQETVLATRSYLIDQETAPVYRAVSPIMTGISEPPNVLGYVATTPKDTAQVVLSADGQYDDPLLAQWQYGLGRSVAFMSDATNRWGNNWLNWADYGRFWGQAVSWTITESANQNIETRITSDGITAQITLDGRDQDGNLLNGASFVGSLLLPDNSTQNLTFQQTNAGEYIATFKPQDEGAYFVAINGTDPDGNSYSTREGWVKSYSAEYAQNTAPTTLLADIATLTNGSDVSADPTQIFAPPRNPKTTSVSLAGTLFILAMCLLPLDIAIRRLIITQSDLQRLRAWLRPTRTSQEDDRLNALKVAKSRIQQETRAEIDLPTSSPIITPVRPVSRPVSNVITSDEAELAKPRSGETSTVGALLKRRKDSPDTTTNNENPKDNRSD